MDKDNLYYLIKRAGERLILSTSEEYAPMQELIKEEKIYIKETAYLIGMTYYVVRLNDYYDDPIAISGI